jgi:hypothetical protein
MGSLLACSTYFECDQPENSKRKFGYSRDKRPDCVQVVIALIVTPEGFPLSFEVLDGNTSCGYGIASVSNISGKTGYVVKTLNISL